MGAYEQGILGPEQAAAHLRNSVYVIASNWFVNRTPLVSRLPRVPEGSTTFNMVFRQPRPTDYTVNAALANNTLTTLTLTDISPLMAGDILELHTSERVQIVGTINTTANTAVVRREVEGTSGAAAVNNNTTARLIGNSRSGKAIDQEAAQFTASQVAQYCQTFQHPVQVGGSLQAETNFITQQGARTPLDQYKMDAIQNLVDDMERTLYYGKGEASTSSVTLKMKGLRYLCGNVVTDPTNKGAYKPTDFIRDLLQGATAKGGQPDFAVLSSEFQSGLATWGHQVQRVDAGTSEFGTPIDMFHAPFLAGISLVFSPLLRPYTAIGLTSSEVRLRMKRNEFWNPRGVRGDAIEGEYIAEGAIDLDNPYHHSFVEGITAFAASA